jgi:2'-5' RNA ligase
MSNLTHSEPSTQHSKLRLFTAVPLPAALTKKLAEVQSSLESSLVPIRFVPPENLHLTLHFLGPTPSNLLEDFHHDLGAAAHRHRPFDLALNGLGCFPDTENPRVLWAGIRDAHGRLKELEEDCRRVLDQYRLFKLEQDYVPHVTLGRLSGSGGSKAFENALKQWGSLGRLPVEKFVLFQSRQDAGRTVYGTVEEFVLKG